MGYMGGKSKVGKDISKIINSYNPENFVSLFCGSCAVESLVDCEHKYLNDNHYYLIEMYKALQTGWKFPTNEISKDEYFYIKDNPDENKALTGFVGFGCSFGGKWFGGYASNARGDNYTKQGVSCFKRGFNGCKDATFTCLDYKDVHVPDNSVVYCDPPYCGTTKYMTGDFNHIEFWDFVRDLSKRNVVLISEYSAPYDFECIWEKNKIVTLEKSNNKKDVRIERLFKLR